ncbi:MAG: site-specific integrase [Acidimicrobiia bacterium]|nr:site-specific integrase [Acidimicrobiia bacterium]
MKGSVRKPRTAWGTWSYRIDGGFDDRGRRRQREVGGFRTKKEAQAALNDALAETQRGTYVAPSRTTVGDFLDEWHEGAKTELALTAWTNYGQIIRRNIRPYLGSKRLTDLTPLDVKRWHGKLLEGGRRDGGPLSVASVKLAHRILHRALADAVRWNLIPTNPASGVRVPKSATKEMTVWTAEEATRFLDAVAEDRLVALWTLALHTGLRRGELAGLRWVDVDLDASMLTVAQQRTTANHATVVTAPNAKSQRQLLLAPATVAALKAHLRHQRQERLALGPAWTDRGYVFVDEAGVEFHPHRFTKMFEDAIKRTGAPKIRLHDTRHTMASLALEAGVHPKVVQEQLGHSAIAVTLDRYSHVPQAVRRDSADKIAGLFQ